MSSFKTIYFPDYQVGESGKSGLTVSFSDNEKNFYQSVSKLSSFSIRTAIGHHLYSDVVKAADQSQMTVSAYVRTSLNRSISLDKPVEGYDAAIQSTFSGGKGSPLHDWFPYLEGYSPDFVRTVISQYAPQARRVFDPFCGSGTTALTAAGMGIQSVYCEVNPVCRDVINAKSLAVRLEYKERSRISNKLENLSMTLNSEIEFYREDTALSKSFEASFSSKPFFDTDTYSEVLKLRSMADDLMASDISIGKLFEIAVLGALIPSSFLVRRGDLRFRTEKELQTHLPNILSLVSKRLRLIASDLNDVERSEQTMTLIGSDARLLNTDNIEPVDIVVTSPPYLNGTNYFRNTKMELWFQRHLSAKSDLRKFRDSAVTSGINDVTNSKTGLGSIPNIELLNKTLTDLRRESYDKRIPMMASSYFAEMTEVVRRIKDVCHQDTKIAIDLGDSCYGSTWVQTDVILREIMELEGFNLVDEIVLRERQSRDGRRLRQTLQVFGVVK
ncbi:site-specific DNA-methyltransferase [Pseudomonas fulva]|uniref:site-specific DNA-methyltransferase n=1 Tax=Pseudomonas fulva TaxID=47880 RepID=UPI001428D53C|nr:site-specific DNA-methyltransferase [Pseudomonas fulva]NIX92541.1 site-specific DNA-methyltransferase [Pseudomonas fulva]